MRPQRSPKINFREISLGCSIFDFCNNIGQKADVVPAAFCLRKKKRLQLPGSGLGPLFVDAPTLGGHSRRGDANSHVR